MADLDLEWKSDFGLSPSGDLALTDGSDLTRQRFCRRLFTPVKGYTWHLEYGQGLPQRIGNTLKPRDAQALVQSAALLESTIAKIPRPIATIAEDQTVMGLYNVTVTYTDAATGTSVSLNREIPQS